MPSEPDNDPGRPPGSRERGWTGGPRGTGFRSIVTSVLDWITSSPQGQGLGQNAVRAGEKRIEQDGGESQGCNADGYACGPACVVPPW